MIGVLRNRAASAAHGLAGRGVRTLAVLVFGLTAAVSAHAGSGKNLLENGDCEAGGKSVGGWMTVYPPALAKPAPVFTASTDAPHGGKRCASVVVEYTGGYTSFTQSVSIGKGVNGLHFEAWARVDANPGGKGAADLVLFFVVPSEKDGGEMVQSKRLVDVQGWTKLTLDAAVPEGATEVLTRLGVFGPCSASFDDAVLTSSDVKGTACKLAVARGDYRVKAKASTDKAWIALSIPFPIGGETPLAVRVKSEPEGRVAALQVVKERENRPLKVLFEALKPGDEVAITVETLTLLRDRPVSDGAGVALPVKAKVPKDVAPHLKAAPGVDVDDAAVRKLASAFARKDLQALTTDLAKALRERLKYDGGASQGAKECLDSGKAVCTGYANVAASLFIAAGVPCRILACDLLGSRLQEHYIVEAWTSALGWSRMESTGAAFPYKDSESLVLRIVYPDSERSPFDVPLYVEGSSDVAANFRMGADGCWQGSELLSTHFLDSNAITAIENEARANFEELAKAPEHGARSVFLVLDPAEKSAAKAEELFTAVKAWFEGR
ncbi:MAG: transglutaminase domain-containing protein [Planctomycetes bacterium]|nr:transglutaminase domain-containing protein [Planctomycetota bacterium]